MSQICRGICVRLKLDSPVGNVKYGPGQKRCSLCALFLTTNDVQCPCCKTRLRTKPRSRHNARRI